MVNKVILIGVIAQLDTLQETSQGRQFLNFTVSTTESWETEAESKECTELHPCVLWGKAAETGGRFLAKGRPLYLEGKLHTHTWLDELQRVYRRTEIVVLLYRFLTQGGPVTG